MDPGIHEARAGVGLTAPVPAERRLIWERVEIPSAGVKGYRPPRLLERIFDHPARSKLIAGGVRAGKSLASAVELACWTPHASLIWLAADTYDLTRQEFEYAAEALVSLGFTERSLISLPRQRYMPCVLETYWGCRVESRSLRDIETFVARAPDLVVVCEPGQADRLTVEKAHERLSTRRGLLWMAGTFEQMGEKGQWMEDLWRRWSRWPNPDGGKSFSLPTWANVWAYPGGRADPELLRLRASYPSEREWLLRVAGVPVPAVSLVLGSYWDRARHVDERVRYLPVWEGSILPVELAVDPGYSGGSHYAVLAIQRAGEEIRVVDEVAVSSMVHEEVIEICRKREWWERVSGGVIDPYAGSSHIYGARSPAEVWMSAAGKTLRPAPRASVEDLVNQVATALRNPATGRPALKVSPRARRLIWEMEHWRRARLPGGQGYGPPSRNNCDAVKALGYWLLDLQVRLSGGLPRVEEREFRFV